MDLYSKSGLTLPYLKDTEVERWYEEGQQKIKYTRIWLVMGTEANDFIENLERSYNGKNLTSVSRNDMGGLCEISAVYGERNWDDGEQEWYTVSGGRLTHHLSKWVKNNAASIKSFCSYAVEKAIYKDGVSVSCSPVAGDPYVLCEASWDAQDEDDIEDDDPDNPDYNPDEEEEDIKETGQSVQFSSSTESLTVDRKAVEENDVEVTNLPGVLEIIALLEAGQVSWQDTKTNTMITKNGWYRVTNNVLALKEGPVNTNDELTPEKVNLAKSRLDNPPTFIFPVIRCSLSTRIESADKMTVENMTGDLSNVGQTMESITAGGTSISAPQFTPLNTTSSQYSFETKWLYEGSSYDQSSTFEKTNKKGELRFVGNKTASYRTVTQLNSAT